MYDFLCIINFYMFYTSVVFICILIIYVADHRFIPAVPLCSADRSFFLRINKDIIILLWHYSHAILMSRYNLLSRSHAACYPVL